MAIDWDKVWQEFNEELEGYLRSGKPNEWRVQQDMIRGAIERNLTTGAVDVAWTCPKCLALYEIELPETCMFCNTPRN